MYFKKTFLLKVDVFDVIMGYFIFFGSVFSLTLSFGQLSITVKSLKNWMLFLTYLSLGISLCLSWIVKIGLSEKIPIAFPLHLPAIFELGPTMFIFCKAGLESDFQLTKYSRLIFLPGILVFLFSILHYFLEPSIKVQELLGFFYFGKLSIYDYLLILGFIINIFYYLYFLASFYFIWSVSNLKRDLFAFYFLMLILISVLITFLALSSYLYNDINLLHQAAFLISVILILAYIIQSKYPQFFLTMIETIHEKKYSRSLLKDIDLNSIEKKLKRFVDTKEYFCQDDITLNSLASDLNLTSHQLSQYLNENLNINFSSYINEQRISLAKQMLVNSPEKTVLSIAYQTGFSSKSTFNAVFIKFVEMSPTVYRKKYRK